MMCLKLKLVLYRMSLFFLFLVFFKFFSHFVSYPKPKLVISAITKNGLFHDSSSTSTKSSANAPSFDDFRHSVSHPSDFQHLPFYFFFFIFFLFPKLCSSSSLTINPQTNAYGYVETQIKKRK